MSQEGPVHRFLNHRAVKYLRRLLGNLAEVMEAHPITLVDSEPEPDITIVRIILRPSSLMGKISTGLLRFLMVYYLSLIHI